MLEYPRYTVQAGTLDLVGDHPHVMGVLNLTPDSFSDGGKFLDPAKALQQAANLIDAGAAILDIGGESTRPGASAVSEQQEIDRVMPVLTQIKTRFPTPISIDTSSPELMRMAIDAGVAMINDVRGLTRPGALETLSDSDVAVCLMHMRGSPADMQDEPSYGDPVDDVMRFLEERLDAATSAGIVRSRVILDPGFGFGKNLRHNLALLRRLEEMTKLGCPLLVGVSRKRMIGELTGRAVDQRDTASAIVAAIAALNGAAMLRTHNVEATLDAVKIAAALRAIEDQGE